MGKCSLLKQRNNKLRLVQSFLTKQADVPGTSEPSHGTLLSMDCDAEIGFIVCGQVLRVGWFIIVGTARTD